MPLTITPETIRELAETAERTRRADSTGILLLPHGWDIRVWADHKPDTNLIALTAETIYVWLDGAEDLDDETAEALATPDQAHGDSYQIPHEDGSLTVPGDDADVQVVTATLDEDSQGVLRHETVHWSTAWWFDQARAIELVTEEPGAYRETGRATSLWLTEGGRYVVRLRTAYEGEIDGQWAEATLEQAVQIVYRAGHAQIPDPDRLPAVLAAARQAADMVDLFTPPAPSTDSDPTVRRAHARRHLEGATELVHGIRALSELIRTEVLADLKRHRSGAAHIVLIAHDGDREEAAELLGISYPTLNGLLRS